MLYLSYIYLYNLPHTFTHNYCTVIFLQWQCMYICNVHANKLYYFYLYVRLILKRELYSSMRRKFTRKRVIEATEFVPNPDCKIVE